MTTENVPLNTVFFRHTHTHTSDNETFYVVEKAQGVVFGQIIFLEQI